MDTEDAKNIRPSEYEAAKREYRLWIVILLVSFPVGIPLTTLHWILIPTVILWFIIVLAKLAMTSDNFNNQWGKELENVLRRQGEHR